MGLSQVGGLLLVAGSVLAAVSLVVGSPGAFGSVLLPPLPTAFVALLGAGATTAAIAGRGVFGAQRTRALLSLTAVGLLALGLGSILSLLGSGDPLSNPGIAVGFIGLVVTFFGAILAGLVLIATAGMARVVGLALSAGMPFLLIGTFTRAYAIGEVLGPAGSILLIGGFVGLGILALSERVDRATA